MLLVQNTSIFYTREQKLVLAETAVSRFIRYRSPQGTMAEAVATANSTQIVQTQCLSLY
jgi:hypothetical protein